MVERIEYDEHYGQIIEHTKKADVETMNPYGYTGREIETNELYYYRARYYDASIQRFLSLDPIGFESGDFNFYRYVSNSPLNFTDPSGLKIKEAKDTIEGTNDLFEIIQAAIDGAEEDGVKGVVENVLETVLEQRGLKYDASILDEAEKMKKICLKNASKLDAAREYQARKVCAKNYANDVKNTLFDDVTKVYGHEIPGLRTNDDVNYSTEAYIDHSDENVTVEAPPIDVPDDPIEPPVCRPYGDVIDENTSDDNIARFADEEKRCVLYNSVDPTPSDITNYVERDKEYVSSPSVDDDKLIRENDNSQSSTDNNSTVSKDNNLSEEEQAEADARDYD